MGWSDNEALRAPGPKHALADLRSLHVDLCGLRHLAVRSMSDDGAARGNRQRAQVSGGRPVAMDEGHGFGAQV